MLRNTYEHELKNVMCYLTNKMKYIVIFITLFCCSCFGPKYNKTDITFRACYEGTQNQAVFFLFGKDQTFLIHWTGVFFYDETFSGYYTQTGDTLYLKYKDNKVPKGLTEKLFMNHQEKVLVPMHEKMDTNNFTRYFYYGSCKGLN